MNRSTYFNYIEEKLELLALRISKRGKINLLDLHIYSEAFFADIINILLKYQFANMNAIEQNVEGIDLIDEDNKLLAQVSSTCTKQKIENSISKDIYKKYPGYRYKFIAISGEADKLRSATYNNPHKINFTPTQDIYDMKSILNIVLNMKIDDQQNLYTFIKKELGCEYDAVRIDSNLTTIINILSKENLSRVSGSPEINTYEIERKIAFNDLSSARYIIDEYKIYYGKLNEKYKEFDKQGANKSLSVFSAVRNQYVKLLSSSLTPHELLFSTIENIIVFVMQSRNYSDIPYEELEMCVSIIVVDAFIRCKIFKNPEGYNHVTA